MKWELEEIESGSTYLKYQEDNDGPLWYVMLLTTEGKFIRINGISQTESTIDVDVNGRIKEY